MIKILRILSSSLLCCTRSQSARFSSSIHSQGVKDTSTTDAHKIISKYGIRMYIKRKTIVLLQQKQTDFIIMSGARCETRYEVAAM